MIDFSKVVCGGDVDARENYIGPTILYNVHPEDKIMQDEIFGNFIKLFSLITCFLDLLFIFLIGPILPFITVKDHNEAIEFINKRYAKS